MVRTKLANKDKFIKSMGDELGEIFYALHCEVFWLNVKWNEYQQLFDFKPERLELLNNSAPFFFKMIHEIMFEDFMLHLSRLTGPVQSCGKTNLTIRRLLSDSITDEKYERIKSHIKNLIDAAVKESEFTDIWRNKTLAHLDLNVSLDKSTLPEHVQLVNIKNAINAITNLLNAIHSHYLGVLSTYDPFGMVGVQALINIIEDGLACNRC